MYGFGILKTRITVLRVHFYGSLRFTAVVLTAVNFWDSNPNGMLRVPVQLYRTTRIVRLRCAALIGFLFCVLITTHKRERDLLGYSHC